MFGEMLCWFENMNFATSSQRELLFWCENMKPAVRESWFPGFPDTDRTELLGTARKDLMRNNSKNTNTNTHTNTSTGEDSCKTGWMHAES